jgi:hypothetical protein
MATEAQIAANRKNAKASTGPKTAEGKARSSRNALSFGLFSTTNCVQAEEQEEYEALSKGLWEDLNPVGLVEQMFATEIIRGAWRLRRCAEMEGTIALFADRMSRRKFAEEHPDRTYKMTRDPLFYDFSSGHQVAADRARAHANSTVRRATTELRRLQTERLLRSVFLPTSSSSQAVGLASLSDVLPFLDGAQRKEWQGGRTHISPAPVQESVTQSPEPESTNRSQSDTAETENASAKQTQSAMKSSGQPQPFRHSGTAGDTAPGHPEAESSAYPHSGTAGDTAPGHPETESPAYPHPCTAGDTTSGQIPRSAPCPCGTGLKYKRCCGKEAPAVLYTAAA